MTERALRRMEACVQTHSEQTHQGFVENLKTTIKRFLQQFRIIRRTLRHPQVPWYAKLVAGCGILYVVSPIQIIPNFIPIIGQMDDVLVVSLAIRIIKRCVTPSVLEDCQDKTRRHP